MLIRCTNRLLKVLGATTTGALVSVPGSPNDWYANLLWLDRRKCLLLTHAGTLFTVFEAGIGARELRPLHEVAARLVVRELAAAGLPADALGDLASEERWLAKTVDRSVLGCMNDMASACEWAVADAGSLAATDVADLNASLRRNINRPRGYRPPVDLAAEWASRVSED